MACLLAFAAVTARASHPALTVPVTGQRFEGRLLSISPQGQAVFAAGDAQRTIPLADLVSWGAVADPADALPSSEATRGAQVLLAGGGMVVADKVRTAGEALVVDSEVFLRQSIPLELVAAILFRPPLDVQQRDRLANQLLGAAERTDRARLENGDELTGTILGITDAGVEIESQGQKTTVPLPRVTALGFDASLAAAPKPGDDRILAGFRDGSRMVASRVVLDDKQVHVALAEGTPWDAAADALVFLQPLSGKARYLSDQRPEAYKHLPYLNLSWPFKNDTNVTGTQLRSGGQAYAKGLGMHSAARLTYRLSRPYRTFEADVALDDQVASQGSAVFAVYVDDKPAYKSEVIRGGAAPVPVKVDVTGAKRLSLIVEYADRGDELDRANWLSARLIE